MVVCSEFGTQAEIQFCNWSTSIT